MTKFQLALAAVASAIIIAVSAACAADAARIAAPSDSDRASAGSFTPAELATATPTAAGLRLRCERRASRSKISVDGRNIAPRGGAFRARVRAAGGTVTSGARKAVGDEVEFDFDSNQNDIREGATRVAANFIRSRPGADVLAQILDAQGHVVATQGGDCESR